MAKELRSVQIIKELNADFEAKTYNYFETEADAVEVNKLIAQLLKDFFDKTKHFSTDTQVYALKRAIDENWK